MWRPEGFYKLIAEMPTNTDNLVEFIADAMLTALKEKAVTLTIADQAVDVPGFYIIFIPKED